MTPAEHLAEAERLLDTAQGRGPDIPDEYASYFVWGSIAHALIAAAAELGVPHDGTTTGGTGATPQPAAG